MTAVPMCAGLEIDTRLQHALLTKISSSFHPAKAYCYRESCHTVIQKCHMTMPNCYVEVPQ